jgi:hypothetical protein
MADLVAQRSGLGLHRHLNHNDLSHVATTVATWLFFRGLLVLPG